jgi:hypothetical protein
MEQIGRNLVGKAHRQHLRREWIDRLVSRHENLLPETTKPLQKSSGLCAKSAVILGFSTASTHQLSRGP